MTRTECQVYRQCHTHQFIIITTFTIYHPTTPRLQNDLYYVEWDVKLQYTIPYLHHSFTPGSKPISSVQTPGILQAAFMDSLSLRFNGHFPGRPGLAGTRMSPFWLLLEQRMMEMVVTTGAVRRAKLQSKCHHQQTNTQCFTSRMPFLSPKQQHQSTEGKAW